MEQLLQFRDKIDEIDQGILKLFEQRMELSGQVAEYKIMSGKHVLDRKREMDKLDKLKSQTEGEFNRHGVEELFKQIMAISRKLQYQILMEHGIANLFALEEVEHIGGGKPRVVFQGVEGAYGQQAMQTYFGNEIEDFHVETFRDAMQAVADKKADFAVLPIENSSAGIVNEIYDLIVEYENHIVGEQILKIEHALVGQKGSSLEQIQTVYSHPQGLMQCVGFLDQHRDWKQISLQNTAIAAKKVLEDGDPTQAAIASKMAADYYGLCILKEALNFSEDNSTRFIIITGQEVFLKNAGKISICFELPHESGSLYNILSHFIFNGLNLCKIESRPLQGRNWEYRFFIDFEGNLMDSAVKNALFGINKEVDYLRILGNYA